MGARPSREVTVVIGMMGDKGPEVVELTYTTTAPHSSHAPLLYALGNHTPERVFEKWRLGPGLYWCMPVVPFGTSRKQKRLQAEVNAFGAWFRTVQEFVQLMHMDNSPTGDVRAVLTMELPPLGVTYASVQLRNIRLTKNDRRSTLAAFRKIRTEFPEVVTDKQALRYEAEVHEHLRSGEAGGFYSRSAHYRRVHKDRAAAAGIVGGGLIAVGVAKTASTLLR